MIKINTINFLIKEHGYARYLPLFILCFYAQYNYASPDIELRVNLGGYGALMPKKVLILSNTKLTQPILLLKNTVGKTIKKYKATSNEHTWAPFSNYYTVDFSNFDKKGIYYFELKGNGIVSKRFKIGPYPNWQEDVVDFIRTQRCGFNPFTKEFCHQKDGLSFFGLQPDSTRN